MKKNNPLIILSIVICILSVLATLYIYPTLPNTIATHFNSAGVADHYGHKNNVFITALLPFFIITLSILMPQLDPQKNAYLKHTKAYSIFIFAISVFLVSIHWCTVLFSLGYPILMQKVVPIALGFLFICIGSYLPQIHPNYTLGIKLPWTLNDENNWRATHHIGGYLFILQGIINIISAFLPKNLSFTIFITSLFIILFIIVTYSYIYYRKHDID